ncbi:MAG: hypothetical protein H6811_06730 [Phycisphaeraceae bacterium]|nr:hypothetical protein [Phycisphaeraceae bacterium]
MRAVLLLDLKFAERERKMLERVEIGLADDGVSIIHAIPETLGDHAESGLFGRAVTYPADEVAITRGRRVRKFAASIRSVLGAVGDGRAADVVHVWGGQLWPFAQRLSLELGSALALEVWRAGLAAKAESWLDRRTGAGTPVFFAPDEAIASALGERGLGASTRLVPWGVHAAKAPREILREQSPVSVVIVGSGRDALALRGALGGLRSALDRGVGLVVFLDAEAARRAQLWKQIRRLKLTGVVSLIEGMEAHRELLMQADVLMAPEARHEQRSIVLDAMGAGMLVIAGEDPLNGALRDSRTVRVVRRPHRLDWEGVLVDALEKREASREIARTAWDWVRERRRVSGQISAILDTYDWMTSKDALPFAGAQAERA